MGSGADENQSLITMIEDTKETAFVILDLMQKVLALFDVRLLNLITRYKIEYVSNYTKSLSHLITNINKRTLRLSPAS